MRLEPFQEHTFEGGMIRDVSPELLPPSTYIDGRNMIIEDIDPQIFTFPDGSQIKQARKYRVQNPLGMVHEFSLPAVPIWSRRRACFVADDPAVNYTVIAHISLTNGTITEAVDTTLVTILAPDFNLTPLVDTMNGALGGLGVPVKTFLTDCNCISLITTDLTWTITSLTFTLVGATLAGGAAQNIDIPATPNPQITGYTWDADTLILASCDFSSVNPAIAPAPGNPSQIWMIDISDYQAPIVVTLAQLKYDDLLNFSLVHQIGDTMQLLPENQCLIRLYWTDNFTPPKTLDLAQPGIIIEPPGLVNLNPDSKGTKMQFYSYGNGALLEGNYQYTSRLAKSSGEVTFWEPLSKHINVIAKNTGEYCLDTPDGLFLPSSYSIILQFSNIDTNYDTLEIAVAYFTVYEGPPADVYFVAKQTITGPIMLVEQTDNAHRFETLTIDQVTAAAQAVIRLKDEIIVPALANEVSGNRLVGAGPCYHGDLPFTQQMYTLDPALGTTNTAGTIGAKSVNQPMTSDQYLNDIPSAINRNPYFGNIAKENGSFYSLNGYTLPPDNIGDFQLRNDWGDTKGGAVAFNRYGYMGGETYRFGIELEWLDGTRTLISWIGDFTFPKRIINGDHCNDYTADPDTDIINSLAQISSFGLYLNTIDMSAYVGKIRGFRIVRALRDKQILAQGLLTPTLFDSGATNAYFPYVIGIQSPDAVINTDTTYQNCAFYSPDIDFHATDFADGSYQFQILGRLFATTVHLDVSTGYAMRYSPTVPVTLPVDDYLRFFLKFYNPAVNCSSQPDLPIDKLQVLLNPGDVGPWVGSTEVQLKGFFYSDGLGGSELGDLGRCAFLHFSNPLLVPDATNFPFPFPTSPVFPLQAPGFWYGNLYKPKDVLYGGTSLAALQATQYYYTGHYQPVDDCNQGDGAYKYEALVYGGDTFTTFYTRCARYDPPANKAQVSGIAFAFPVESSINTPLRYAVPPQFLVEQATATFLAMNQSAPESFSYGDVANNNDYPSSQDTYQFTVGKQLINVCDQMCLLQRVIATGGKLLGEPYDAFQFFLADEYLDLSPLYGNLNRIDFLGITSIQNIRTWQDLAIGMIPYGQQSLITPDVTQAVVLGTGQLLAQWVGLSVKVGSKHKFSVLKTGLTQDNQAHYFWDAVNGALMRWGPDGVKNLGVEYGLNSYFQNTWNEISQVDNPIYLGGVQGGQDYVRGIIYFTYRRLTTPAENFCLHAETIGFSDRPGDQEKGKFLGFFDFTPKLYLPLPGNRFMSPNPYNPEGAVINGRVCNPSLVAAPASVYQHYKNTIRNSYYGNTVPAPMSITFVLNKDRDIAKKPTFLELLANRNWDVVDMIGTPVNNIAGTYRQMRSTWPMDNFEPRQDKWQGDLRFAMQENTDVDAYGNFNPASWVYIEPEQLEGGNILVRLTYNGADGVGELRTLQNVLAYYVESLRNR